MELLAIETTYMTRRRSLVSSYDNVFRRHNGSKQRKQNGLMMSAERDKQIAELVRLKYSIAQIARIVGITPRSVVRAKRRMGLTIKVKPPLSREQHAMIKRLIADGASRRDIAETVGCHHETILKHYEYGWDRRQVAEASVMSRRLAKIP